MDDYDAVYITQRGSCGVPVCVVRAFKKKGVTGLIYIINFGRCSVTQALII